MISIEKIVRGLRDNADWLENAGKSLVLPDFTGTDLRSAFARLKSAFPETTFSIQPPRIMHYGHSNETKACDSWSIYVHIGAKVDSFTGMTLPEAVNAALRSLQPPPADPVEDVQAALTPAPF